MRVTKTAHVGTAAPAVRLGEAQRLLVILPIQPGAKIFTNGFFQIHGYSVDSRTNPSRTGFRSKYPIFASRFSDDRNTRSNDSGCQTRPFRPSALLVLLSAA